MDSGSEGKALATARLTLLLWVHLFSELCNMEEVQHLRNHRGRGFWKERQFNQSFFRILGLMEEDNVLPN